MSHAPGGHGPSRQQLEDVVKTSTLKRLETVLLEICNESPEAFKIACEKLLVIEEQAGRPTVSLLDGPLGENVAFKLPNAQKRGRRYEICGQCKKEYDVLAETKCKWHPGELEVYEDDDFWADWDEPHAVRDTEYNRKEYPEGFLWSCCEEQGDAKGCRTDSHQPRAAKRSRIESPDDESSLQSDDDSSLQSDSESE